MAIRLDATPQPGEKRGTLRRMRLRRADGRVYLDRWGIAHERLGRIYLHRMTAPDPGDDLHDHPWAMLSIVLRGGYTEVRCDTREACARAAVADQSSPKGLVHRRPFTAKVLRLDEAHTIIRLHRATTWTLVIGGPRRRLWGFYTPAGFVTSDEYHESERGLARGLRSVAP